MKPSQTGPRPPAPDRRRRGQRAWHAGRAAEEAVARVYQTRGATLLERRWRGAGGEVDLIVLENGEYVFCEVKAARDAGAAMQRLRPAQVQRIHAAASEYLGTTPEGQLTTLRFDLATVDETGRVDIVENAFGHF